MGWQLKKGTIVDYLKAMIQKAKKNLIFHCSTGPLIGHPPIEKIK